MTDEPVQRVVVTTRRWVRPSDPASGGGALVEQDSAQGSGSGAPRCNGCGYDMSGVASGACPECGERLGRSPMEPPEPALGGFLTTCTVAYSLGAVGSLVFAFAGMINALGGPGRVGGVALLLVTVACVLIVRWLVHRPEGYPNGRPTREIVLVWLFLGIPAALVVAGIVVLTIAVVVILIKLIFGMSMMLNLPLVAAVVGACAVIATVVAMVAAIVKS